MEQTEISPGHKNHPFWKSDRGSELILEMIMPPDSQLRSLHIKVYSVSSSRSSSPINSPNIPARSSFINLKSPRRNVVYHLTARYAGGGRDTMFANETEARAVINDEWLCFYQYRTRVTFIEHRDVDMKQLLQNVENDSSPRAFCSPFSPRSQRIPTTNLVTSPASESESESHRDEDVISPPPMLKKRLSLPLRFARPSSAPTSPNGSPRQKSWFKYSRSFGSLPPALPGQRFQPVPDELWEVPQGSGSTSPSPLPSPKSKRRRLFMELLEKTREKRKQ